MMPTNRLSLILVVALMALVTHMLGIYAGDRAERVAALIADIDDDQRDIQVLEAELAYRARPERLQALAGANLALRPQSPAQILPDVALLPDAGVAPVASSTTAKKSEAPS